MTKKPKSIVVSFRLSPLGIAKAVDGLMQYDKASDLSRISSIVKQVTLHGINYLTNALPFEPSKKAQLIVHSLTNQGKPSLEKEILNQKIDYTTLLPADKPREDLQEEQTQEQTRSVKTVITDWSVPEELKEETEKDLEGGNEE